jgi:hypothetical protein
MNSVVIWAFCGSGEGTQGLTHARQVLKPLAQYGDFNDTICTSLLTQKITIGQA